VLTEPVSAVQSPRPLRTSPAYPSHVEAGASFGEKSGWGRVNFFRTNEASGDLSRRPHGAAGKAWSAAIEAEHRATRESAGLFDLTSFGKIEVAGPGAAQLLEFVCDNDVERGPGRATYAQMLNDAGGIVADITVTQIDVSTFFVVTGTSCLPHDIGWIRRHAAAVSDVTIRDVTSGWTCFGVWGPNARDILGGLTPQALDSGEFPYMTMRETTIGEIPVRMIRLTFVGELGWEIYTPSEYGRSLWAQLTEAVQSAGGLRCGYKAIDSLRAEKGYVYLGADVTADTTPYEAGLGFCVRPDKPFVGRDALLAAGQPQRKLVTLALDEPGLVVSGGETVLLDGQPAGTVTSGGLGHTLGLSLAFVYLPVRAVPGTAVRVLLDDRQVAGKVVAQPLYDPKGLRIKA